MHHKLSILKWGESNLIQIPEIHLYVRILDYEGGAHVFSNDTDVSTIKFCNVWFETFSCSSKVFHSDYFSGWDDEMLQYLLDECENYSEVDYNNYPV